jgi:hypothetical protein
MSNWNLKPNNCKCKLLLSTFTTKQIYWGVPFHRKWNTYLYPTCLGWLCFTYPCLAYFHLIHCSSHSLTLLLQEMARETKSPRPLCRKQEFYYASGLRGGNFSKPWALISVRWVIYPWGGLCNQGVFVVRWFTGGQKDKSVTEKQVGYRVSPYRMWLQSQETLQSLAEGLW